MAYKPETKGEALGRLWLTATERAPGVWVPNFRSVEEGMKADPTCESPTRTTIRTWWRTRDKSKDGQFQTLQAETVAKVAEKGALNQIEGMVGVLLSRMKAIVEDESAWSDDELPLPQKTQAAMNMTRALTLAGPLLQANGQGEREETGEDRAARYAAAAQRTGASK